MYLFSVHSSGYYKCTGGEFKGKEEKCLIITTRQCSCPIGSNQYNDYWKCFVIPGQKANKLSSEFNQAGKPLCKFFS